MIVTDEEARTKMCPQDMAADNPNGMCIGSKCMAWRWIDPEFLNEVTREIVKEGYTSGDGGILPSPLYVNHDKIVVEQTKTRIWRNQSRKGYCGMAGKP